jgi:hypothetical protein
VSIRLRHIEGVGLIAICAARSVPKEGDVYLDDSAHHALSVKFADDWKIYGDLRAVVPELGVEDRRPKLAAMDAEESNNPNREEWDRIYK